MLTPYIYHGSTCSDVSFLSHLRTLCVIASLDFRNRCTLDFLGSELSQQTQTRV